MKLKYYEVKDYSHMPRNQVGYMNFICTTVLRDKHFPSLILNSKSATPLKLIETV